MTDLVVSVVVPHYNDPAALELCLKALEAQTLPRDRFEIIVADNMSPVGIGAVRAVVRDRATLIEVPVAGAGPARNGGVTVAKASALAFTDCDCVPEPGWLEAGLKALERYPIVGGQVVVLPENQTKMTAAEAFETVFAFDFETYILRKGFTGSGNLFVSRSIFDDIGGFRVGMSEDMEWSYRATAKGYRIGYEPKAVVAHPGRRDWPELKSKWRRVQSERFGLVSRSFVGQLIWLARTWAMPLSVGPHIWKIARSPRLPDLRTRVGAIVILVRQRLWRFIDGHLLLLRLRK